jgi:uncharacterized phage-associated protein
MKFAYNARKAAQTAAYLVRLNGGRINGYSLIKILYLADRKSLAERGRPITGDAMVSMPLGPVLSRIYDELKSPAEIQNQFWSEYLTEREGNLVYLRGESFPTDELSQYERNVMEAVHNEYRGLSFEDLKNFTHNLPEYTDPRGSSLPIDPVLILKEKGWSDEDIQDIRMSANEELFLRTICA